MVLAVAMLAGTAGGAAATEVEVRVTNVGDAAGQVRVQVCLPHEWLKDGCARRTAVPARPGVMAITIPGVPPGTYAVLAHHDRDGDDEVNQNLLGIPTEGIGFSRAPSILFGEPSFASSAITVAGERVVVEIRLLFE